MLQLHVLPGPTGRLLREMLDQKGLFHGQVKGAVHYGYHSNTGLPTLNLKAGTFNKYEELVKMDEKGVVTVPFSRSVLDLVAPVLGRNFQHTRGNDIRIYRVRPVLPGNHLADYYTELIEKQKEFRVWIFRDKFLAAYEKKLEYPNRNGRRGRNPAIWNWGNGYAYKFVQPEDVPAGLKTLGINAVKALDLDFGAVDTLLGTDGFHYVLEVNTAPGTQGEARQGITSLVNCIERWANNGFLGR